MTLRQPTEFEARHSRQSEWPEAIDFYHEHRQRAEAYGLLTHFGEHRNSRAYRRLYRLGRDLVAQGMTCNR
jgi:hypothetical protein